MRVNEINGNARLSGRTHSETGYNKNVTFVWEKTRLKSWIKRRKKWIRQSIWLIFNLCEFEMNNKVSCCKIFVLLSEIDWNWFNVVVLYSSECPFRIFRSPVFRTTRCFFRIGDIILPHGGPKLAPPKEGVKAMAEKLLFSIRLHFMPSSSRCNRLFSKLALNEIA